MSDGEYTDIDFANSKSDSYRATNNDVMSELNSYFKAYIANVTGESHNQNDTTLDDALDGIRHGSGFDDIMDGINREHDETSTESENEYQNMDNEDDLTSPVQEMLDVEILDQHIDKHGLTGGSDATRAIENMAGGALNGDHEEIDEEPDNHDSFANNMLGMQGGRAKLRNTGAMRGYSGVTNEIRVRGNRVTERNRSNNDYLSENGHVDMGMLGGSFEDTVDDNEQADWKDTNPEREIKGEYPIHKPKDAAFNPVSGPGEHDNEDDEYSDGIDYDNEYEEYDEETDGDRGESTSMASEIDMVLNQLRNKTARTLTGGTVNIRKKVVLTDMYPYIVRS